MPAVLRLVLLALMGCTVPDPPEDPASPDEPPTDVEPGSPGGGDVLEAALADAYRIDLSAVDVELEFHPDTGEVVGHARLAFTLREGVTRALVHFDPALASGETLLDRIDVLRLDDEALTLDDPSAVVVGTGRDGGPPTLELQRDLDPASPHVLDISYRLLNEPGELGPTWLTSAVDDISGLGNENLFPTISSPGELARHRIELSVEAEEPYFFLGSGVTTQDGSTWQLDTVAEVASYTVMLATGPVAAVAFEERQIDGVTVRIAAVNGDRQLRKAFDTVEEVLPRLQLDFGPFPAAHGMNIVALPYSGTGMEYYGGTLTDVSSLSHELTHAYWGCSAVGRTWRDTWWDEAITTWYDVGARRLPADFHSGMVSDRGIAEPGFDTRAYGRGAAMFREWAERAGGDGALLDGLRQVHEQHRGDPLTTWELVEALELSTGVEMRDSFEAWVFGG